MNQQSVQPAAVQAPPKPTAAAAAAQGPTAIDLLAVITDEHERRQLQQQAVDQFQASRASLATGVPSPKIELQIRYGRAFGFNEVESQNWIYLYPNKDGTFKPLLDYRGRAAILKRSGYDWKQVEHTDVKCEYQFERNGEVMTDANGKPLRLCWTIERATKAGLVGRARGKEAKEGDKGTYDNYPQRMLFAKVIHDFGAFYAQEATGADMADRLDALTLDQVVEATEPMKMPEEVQVKETVSADTGK